MKGIIFDIKEFGVHDGPGLVTTVFMKGCPLKCLWCHNPEGQSFKKEIMVRENSCKHCHLCLKKCSHEECKPYGRCLHICPYNLIKEVGQQFEAKELADLLLKNKKVLDGVTFSGGEPLAQADFILEVISYLEGITINMETSGFADETTFRKVLEQVDNIYMDLKLADESLHKKYTGVSNALILENLKILKSCHKNVVIRTPLIRGITDTDENITAIKKLIGDLPYECLEENDMAGVKYKMLNRNYFREEQ